MDVCLQIKQKKFEVLDRRMMFNGLMALMSVTGAVPTGRPPDPHLQGDQVTSRAAIKPSRSVTEEAPTMVFSLLKVPSSAFTIRHHCSTGTFKHRK